MYERPDMSPLLSGPKTIFLCCLLLFIATSAYADWPVNIQNDQGSNEPTAPVHEKEHTAEEYNKESAPPAVIHDYFSPDPAGIENFDNIEEDSSYCS